MSTQGADSLSTAEIRWGISRDELRRRERMHVDATNENERICDDCGRRVTILDSGHEVGHSRGRKDSLCAHYSGPHTVDQNERPDEYQGTLNDW